MCTATADADGRARGRASRGLSASGRDRARRRDGAMKPAEPAASSAPLLEVKGLRKHFPITEWLLIGRKIGEVKAVDGVDFTIRRGETWGWSARAAAARPRPAGA